MLELALGSSSEVGEIPLAVVGFFFVLLGTDQYDDETCVRQIFRLTDSQFLDT